MGRFQRWGKCIDDWLASVRSVFSNNQYRISMGICGVIGAYIFYSTGISGSLLGIGMPNGATNGWWLGFLIGMYAGYMIIRSWNNRK